MIARSMIESDDRVKIERNYQDELRIIEEERNKKDSENCFLGQFVGRDLDGSR